MIGILFYIIDYLLILQIIEQTAVLGVSFDCSSNVELEINWNIL